MLFSCAYQSLVSLASNISFASASVIAPFSMRYSIAAFAEGITPSTDHTTSTYVALSPLPSRILTVNALNSLASSGKPAAFFAFSKFTAFDVVVMCSSFTSHSNVVALFL